MEAGELQFQSSLMTTAVNYPAAQKVALNTTVDCPLIPRVESPPRKLPLGNTYVCCSYPFPPFFLRGRVRDKVCTAAPCAVALCTAAPMCLVQQNPTAVAPTRVSDQRSFADMPVSGI